MSTSPAIDKKVYGGAWQRRKLATDGYFAEMERAIEEANANKNITVRERLDLINSALKRYDEQALPALLQWQDDVGISSEPYIIEWRKKVGVK